MQNKTDLFTKVIAVLGLIISIIALALPIIQDHYNSREELIINVSSIKDNSSIIRLSDNINISKVFQAPYKVTISNSGKVKLSIVSYEIYKILDNGVKQYFSGLDGGIYNLNDEPFKFPRYLDSGESITFIMFIGFIPTNEIYNYLLERYSTHRILKTYDTNLGLAKKGLTIYGDKAVYKEFKGGGFHIEIDSNKIHPVYGIEFKTGRKNSFIQLISKYN